jgi:hypothetical protein
MLLPLVGTYFKKTYQCPVKNTIKSELIYPDKLIFDHSSMYFDGAKRKSFKFNMSKNQVLSAIRSGQFIDIWEGKKVTEIEDNDIEFIETHCEMDLDEDGYSEPYIMLYSVIDEKVASIVPRFAEEDVTLNKDDEVVRIHGENFFTQTIFIPDPTGSCMGMGYGILLGDMFDIIDTNTNQMIDAGTLNNTAANSGIINIGKGSGLRAGKRSKKGTIDINIGKMTTIESDQPLSQNIAQLPFAGPSESLRLMLEQLKMEAREMTSVSMASDASPGEASSLYLARLHQSLIKPNSIMVRVFNGLTSEFKRIYDIQKRYLTQEEYSKILDDDQANVESDYEDESMDIKTTADPSQGSEIERATRAEIVKNDAMMNPAMFNVRNAYIDWYEALGIKDTERYLPEPQPGQPDPIQMMQAQSMQQMSEAEMMKGQADMIEAQAKLIDANIKLAKMDIEIDKLESEVIKNLSTADKNETDTVNNERNFVLANLKEQREGLAQMVAGVQGRVVMI